MMRLLVLNKGLHAFRHYIIGIDAIFQSEIDASQSWRQNLNLN